MFFSSVRSAARALSMAGRCRSVRRFAQRKGSTDDDCVCGGRISLHSRRSSSIRAASRPSRGFEIVRVRFHTPAAARRGLRMRIEQMIRDAGRPLTAFCACELRSPAPFTEDGFPRLQRNLCRHAAEMGRDGRRRQSGRAQQCMPGDRSAGRAVVSCLLLHGGGAQGHCPRSWSRAAARRSKARATIAITPCGAARPRPTPCARKRGYVLGEMERRLGLLGFGWADTTASQVYTVHDLYPFLADEIVRRGAARRADLALRAPAGARARIRDGLPRHRGRTRHRVSVTPS